MIVVSSFPFLVFNVFFFHYMYDAFISNSPFEWKKKINTSKNNVLIDFQTHLTSHADGNFPAIRLFLAQSGNHSQNQGENHQRF